MINTIDPNIECDFLGMKLNNPIVVGSGPLTDSLGRIKKYFSSGAGAVIGKTIFLGKEEDIEEKVHTIDVGMLNSTTYSKKSVEEWLSILNPLYEEGLNIIPSLHAETPELLGLLAKKIAATKCKVVELGIACPNDGSQQKMTPDLIYDYTAKVKNSINASIIVKLAAVDDYLACSKAAIDAGASAISISDTIPAIVYDSTKREYIFEGPAGYSGSAIKPIVLHAIYQIRKAGIKCPILGIGGINNEKDVLDYLHVGANAVQIYTALMINSPKMISEINQALTDWCLINDITIKKVVSRHCS